MGTRCCLFVVLTVTLCSLTKASVVTQHGAGALGRPEKPQKIEIRLPKNTRRGEESAHTTQDKKTEVQN